MNARKSKNFISRLERIDDTLLDNEENITEEVLSFFQHLYTSVGGCFKGFQGVDWCPINGSLVDWMVRPFKEV